MYYFPRSFRFSSIEADLGQRSLFTVAIHGHAGVTQQAMYHVAMLLLKCFIIRFFFPVQCYHCLLLWNLTVPCLPFPLNHFYLTWDWERTIQRLKYVLRYVKDTCKFCTGICAGAARVYEGLTIAWWQAIKHLGIIVYLIRSHPFRVFLSLPTRSFDRLPHASKTVWYSLGDNPPSSEIPGFDRPWTSKTSVSATFSDANGWVLITDGLQHFRKTGSRVDFSERTFTVARLLQLG